MGLHEQYATEVGLFVSVCHRIAARHYVTGYGGNLAWKLEDNVVLITPTMMNKGEITAEDVVFINLQGDLVEGKQKPTGERAMYVKFFGERPDIVSVLHCHAPNAGAFAIRKGKNWLMRPFFPETITEVGPVPLVPYAEPLTEELAREFSPFLRKYNSFLMQNHGLVCMSRDNIEWTLYNVELLEETAYSILMALAGGGKLRELGRKDVKRLGNVMQTRGLPLFGAPGVHKRLEDLYF
jgi:ribulose-5-phosphate 4-epimerase/fuculose-1-phosphate aldolase